LRTEDDGGGTAGCSSIYKYPGETLVYNLADAFDAEPLSGMDPCHATAIQYKGDTIVVSVTILSAFVAVSTSGELKWVLGSADSTFDTSATPWAAQFGFDFVSEDKLVIFDNNTPGSSPIGTQPALGHVLNLDHSTQTTSYSLTYQSGLAGAVLGDAQELPGGNLLFEYVGVLHEVTPGGELVQVVNFGNSSGYINHRSTLYGPPPR
jgi:hypothetical protein